MFYNLQIKKWEYNKRLNSTKLLLIEIQKKIKEEKRKLEEKEIETIILFK